MLITMPQTSSTNGTTNTDTSSSDSASADNMGLSPNDFITLLVAQLKNQDPTNPMDPTQFVSQLVQFNSLEQLISINQDLTPATTTGTTGGTANPSTGAAASAATAGTTGTSPAAVPAGNNSNNSNSNPTGL